MTSEPDIEQRVVDRLSIVSEELGRVRQELVGAETHHDPEHSRSVRISPLGLTVILSQP